MEWLPLQSTHPPRWTCSL